MNNSINIIGIIAKKEYKDSIKSKLFLTLVGFLMALIIVSIIVSSFSFKSQVSDYKISAQILKDMGKTSEIPPMPQFFPLKSMRGVIEYIEIIGAIIGIILGYLSISREKSKRTLQLVLSRPVKKADIINGKFIGNSYLILLVLAAGFVFSFFIIWGVGGLLLTASEIVKLLLVFLFSYLYIMFFFCLSSIFALWFKSLSNALIVCFVIWLVFVLIIPQIGDTMDPDNQIPGGFFKSMNMDKPQQKEVMAKFVPYETTRNALEISSVTKLYERLNFAITGVKDTYNGKDLGLIFKDNWKDLVWILVFLIAAYFIEFAVLLNKRLILNGE
jgi:ABC-type transport system involved in multi-copper enzyme maturation permease subunit